MNPYDRMKPWFLVKMGLPHFFFIIAEGICWLSVFKTMPPTLMHPYICEHWLISEDLLGWNETQTWIFGMQWMWLHVKLLPLLLTLAVGRGYSPSWAFSSVFQLWDHEIPLIGFQKILGHLCPYSLCWSGLWVYAMASEGIITLLDSWLCWLQFPLSPDSVHTAIS